MALQNHIETKFPIAYNYQIEKLNLQTEYGRMVFQKVRDNVKWLISQSGAVMMKDAIKETGGDSWRSYACIDKLIEIGEIAEIEQGKIINEHRIFIARNK